MSFCENAVMLVQIIASKRCKSLAESAAIGIVCTRWRVLSADDKRESVLPSAVSASLFNSEALLAQTLAIEIYSGTIIPA